MSSNENGKRKRPSGDGPSFTIPAKKQKGSKGMSITIPGLKRKLPAMTESPEHDTEPVDVPSGAKALRARQNGMQLWTAVRAARSKDGYEVAHDFLKLPPKRQYPDYYKLIKRPISLDDIKGRLDGDLYPTLKAVKDDLDLCFNNAFTYNMEHSLIWEAAKIMQKIANKEYKLLSQQDDTDGEVDVGSGDIEAAPGAVLNDPGDDEDDDAGSDDGDDGEYDTSTKKVKSPNAELANLLNTRLQKLITKAPKDPGGGLISGPFLVLPSKKEWPQYYHLIKKPIAFDMIEKKLKKKSYNTSAEFAADVEQLFDNAMHFNEDNSPIWLAAQTLRASFHKLMADLPAQYAWTRIQPTKIKLKVQHPKPPPAATPSSDTTAAAPKLAVPTTTTQPQPTKVPVKSQPTLAARKPPPIPPTASATPPAVATPPVAARPSPTTSAPALPSVQPKPPYQHQQPTQYRHSTPQARNPPSSNVVYQPQPLMPGTPGHVTPPVTMRSPSPTTYPTTAIQRVSITAMPSRRGINLFGTSFGDATVAVVRCFAVRLGWGETSIRINVEAERSSDEDDLDTDRGASTPDEGGIASHCVFVDGRKIPMEVKCNGTRVSPLAKSTPNNPSNTKERSTTSADVDEEITGEDSRADMKVNGHTDGDSSGSESDGGGDAESDHSTKPTIEPGVRKTRSGRVPAMTNGKFKRRKKRGPSNRVSLPLGQWDLSLVLGTNVVDMKVGGKEGDSWRIFVDRCV